MIAGFRAISRVLEAGYDIVHVHTPIAAFLTRAAVRRMPAATRPAVVYTAHGFHFYKRGSRVTNLVFLTAERIAGRWTDRLVVINDEDHAAALRHRIVPRDRLVLMPGIGIDTDWYAASRVTPEAFAQARSGLGVESGTPFFAVVGELSMRKRPFDVVAALGRMKHRDPHVVLLGNGPELEESRRRSVRLALPTVSTSSVSWTTSGRPWSRRRRSSWPAVRKVCRAASMEALSLEVPVVATDARGSPDLVMPDAGLIVPIGDVDGLARAMDRMLDEPEAAHEMAVRGRARMVERYELAILIAQHEALYGGLLDERDQGRRPASR